MKMEADIAQPSRAPLQGRSRASFERMISAAADLLIARGSDGFTIADVSQAGKVSIGSIYGRFDSKDDLIRAVQVRALAEIDAEMRAGIDAAAAGSTSLDELVNRLIETMAEVLKEHAPVMRPLMLRATSDVIIATVGKRSHAETEKMFLDALLARAGEIHHPDPARAAHSVFRVVFASVARYLGMGSSTTAAWEGDWDILKEDLEAMSSAFLRHGRGD